MFLHVFLNWWHFNILLCAVCSILFDLKITCTELLLILILPFKLLVLLHN